jgi:acetoin utilization deacetylase AcuC-like enzyme
VNAIEARPATFDELAEVHHEEYIRYVEHLRGRHAALDPDTRVSPESVEAALHAAGLAMDVATAVAEGKAPPGMALVRPPGHHATAERAMGFCVFNNVAVGARQALQVPGIDRVAVLDFDVHHGNGTVDIFQDDERVLVCSSFQHPFYPLRHFDLDRPNIVNTPLAAGTAGAAFRKALERDWLSRVQAHRPQLIFVSAGFDAHRNDPLGGLELDEDDYRWVSELIVELARGSAGGRIVSVLEGGYDLDALARSAHEHVEVLATT